MQAIDINRLSKVYHLRPSQRDWQRLLDATLRDVMNEHLEPALDALGINDHEEVCVRLVHVPLSFNFGKSQFDTSLHWSEIIAQHIRATLDNSSANVIRYATRFHALMSFADDVSRHDLRYSWAWNQLGLVNLQGNAGLAQVREQLAESLVREPGAIFAVFLRLARQLRLARLLGEFSQSAVDLLFDNILREASVDRRWLDTAATDLATSSTPVIPAPVSADTLARSVIFRQLTNSPVKPGAASSPLTLRAWAILVVVELEPMLFHRPSRLIYSFITTVELAFRSATMAAHWRADDPAGDTRQGIDAEKADIKLTGLVDDLAAGGSTPEKQPGFAQESSDSDNTQQPDVIQAINPAQAETRRDEARRDESTRMQKVRAINPASRVQPPITPAIDEQPGSPGKPQSEHDLTGIDTAENMLEAQAQLITSEFGGLFYLLGILGDVAADSEDNLITCLAAEAAFDTRQLSWVLYQLVTRWLTVVTDDAGLRIFCGIDTRHDWPWPSDDRASAHESLLLDDYAQKIETIVFQKLRHTELAAGSLMTHVCRRQARIKIESGWVELLFYLADVDTDIRRAGMDLDPGYVAWLGKVVKIRYE